MCATIKNVEFLKGRRAVIRLKKTKGSFEFKKLLDQMKSQT